MRRYTSLLLTAFLLLILVLSGSVFMARADQAKSDIPTRSITVYTNLPAEHASLLADAFEKDHNIRVNCDILSPSDILKRLRSNSEKETAVVLASSDVLRQAAKEGLLTQYISENADFVPPDFKDPDDMWTGVWYDPVVFCINRDYMRNIKNIPYSWAALAAYQPVRIGITDFMAADAAGNLLYSLIAQFGDKAAYGILTQLHPKVVQYAKYLSNPVRQAGMGEVDISIAVQSEALRYINDGYPLKLIYPADGTAYTLTAAAIGRKKNHEDEPAVQQFMEWLLSDEAMLVQEQNDFFFVPTNPATLAYKKFAGKSLVLFTAVPEFTAEQQHKLMDKWVKEVRFK